MESQHQEGKIPDDLDPKLNEVLEHIENTDRHPENIEEWVSVCGMAAWFLSEEAGTRIHWFCDSKLSTIGERSILGFSFEGGKQTYATKLSEMLDTCSACARKYHEAIENLRKRLPMVNIPESNLTGFFEQLNQFNEDRLNDRLIKTINYSQKQTTQVSFRTLPDDMRSFILEAMYSVELRPNGNLSLWAVFKQTVELLDQDKDLFGMTEVVPTTIVSLFSGLSDKSMHNRARKSLNAISDNSVETFSHLNHRVLRHMADSSPSSSDIDEKSMLLFWYNLNALLKKLTSSAIMSDLTQESTSSDCSEGANVIIKLFNCLAKSPKEQLIGLLLALNTLLRRLGNEFLSFNSATIKSKQLVSTILDNPNFLEVLQKPETPIDEEYDSNYLTTPEHLLDWILSLIQSHNGSSEIIQLGETLFSYLIQLMKSLPSNNTILHNIVVTYILNTFVHSFRYQPPTNETRLPLLEPVARLHRGGLKNLLFTHRNLVIDNLRSTRQSLSQAALQCLQLSIEFDVISALPDTASQRGVEITDETVLAEISRSFPPSLWQDLNKLPRVFDASIVYTILSSMKYSGFIAQPPVKKVTNYLPKKELSQQALLCSIESLQNMSDMDGRVLKKSLVNNNRNGLMCLFLNMFSASSDQNRAAVDLICQAFDSDTVNRLTAVNCLFSHDLKLALSAFCDAIELVKHIQMFAPCSQLTKVAQDVSTTLYDARKGIVDNTKDQFSNGKENELYRYWNVNWDFLRFTFQKTYAWSNQFKAEFMLEFMKDQLDYCKTLLDTFRLVEADLPKPTGDHTNGELLSLPAINTIDPLCQLLRLKDESLVYCSFQNIMTIIDLMKSFKVEFPKRVTDQFVKLAKQEISNIMPREQTSGLLAATGVFSNDEIDEILSKVGFDSRSPSSHSPSPPTTTSGPAGTAAFTTNNNSSTSVSSAPGSYAAAAALGSTNKRSGGQRSINDFMQVTSGPAPSPLPPKPQEPARTTAMDAVRAELNNQKSGSNMMAASSKPQPAKDVHPPRPAGFNGLRGKRLQANEDTANKSKEVSAASGRGESSESSDDDSDDEGLFTAKKSSTGKGGTVRNINKPTVTPIGMDRRGQRIVTMSEKEREERNMRARLNIDLSPLYRQVLSWDFHSKSDYPNESRKYDSVVSSFKSVEHYQKTLEPLLLLECWQGIQRAKEETTQLEVPFKLVVGNRITCDDFIDIYASVEASVLLKVKLSDSDLLVLTYYDNPDMDPKRPSMERAYCLAKVRELKISSSAEYADLILRTFNPKSMLSYLSSKTILHGLRVMSMTTIEREFSSLKGLPFYDLGTAIYKAEPSKPVPVEESKIQQTMKMYNVNESQARAISSSISTKGFSLIQGPPGTGKTKTILGIIGALLTSTTISANSAPTNGANGAIPGSSGSGKQILVCAPSNAAVDELVLRLKQGIVGSYGKRMEPSVVRLGRSEAINSSVKELTLEDQIDQAIARIEQEAVEEPNKALRDEQTETVAKRNALRMDLEKGPESGKQLTAEEYEEKDNQVRELNRKIKELGHQLDMQREKIQSAARRRESERRKIQSEILHKSQIICSTLSGSSHNVLSSLQMKFETVIIDEAAQAIELSALIPLKYGGKQCVMVGDPNQLPPTVLSQTAANLKYEQSLFVRMFNRFNDAVHMLNMQFRMHPAISRFPSKEFYKGKLLDGPHMAEITARPWHSSLFPPYKFLDVSKGKHTRANDTKSLFNRQEAQIAFELFSNLIAYDPTLRADQIGIISPYKRQVKEIRNLFRRELGEIIAKQVDFNTIDGFQGQEKDVIILSCVRAQADAKGVGFLSDTRRMNVAVTRARSSLWILGSETSLKKNPVWNRLIQDARSRKMYQQVDVGFIDKALKEGNNEALSVEQDNVSSRIETGERNIGERGDDDNENDNEIEIEEIFTYSKDKPLSQQQVLPPRTVSSVKGTGSQNDSSSETSESRKRVRSEEESPQSKRIELSTSSQNQDPRAALLGGNIPSPLPNVSPSPSMASDNNKSDGNQQQPLSSSSQSQLQNEQRPASDSRSPFKGDSYYPRKHAYPSKERPSLREDSRGYDSYKYSRDRYDRYNRYDRYSRYDDDIRDRDRDRDRNRDRGRERDYRGKTRPRNYYPRYSGPRTEQSDNQDYNSPSSSRGPHNSSGYRASGPPPHKKKPKPSVFINNAKKPPPRKE